MRLGHPALYQQVVVRLILEAHSSRQVIDLGDKLVELAEQAYSLRQLNQLVDLSQALLALPLPHQYASAGRYFRGLELIRRGDLEMARTVLEGVAAEPSHGYTARAIQSLGVTFHARGDFESALKLYTEAGLRAAERPCADRLTELVTQRNIAVLKSGHGDNRGALADLERMAPFARAVGSVHPQAYYDYLNSLAVEFGTLGRLEEATRASRIALSSPFAHAYPEWRQTFEEITYKQERASHSAVAVRQPARRSHSIDEPGNKTS